MTTIQLPPLLVLPLPLLVLLLPTGTTTTTAAAVTTTTGRGRRRLLPRLLRLPPGDLSFLGFFFCFS